MNQISTATEINARSKKKSALYRQGATQRDDAIHTTHGAPQREGKGGNELM